MMTAPLNTSGLGLRPGDHACAFYWSTSGAHADLIASYVAEGIEAGDKCICFIDDQHSVVERLPEAMADRADQLVVMEPDGWYVPEERFSAEEHLARLDAIVRSALSDEYKRVRLVGDASFVFRRAVEHDEWFRYEAQVNLFADRYPQYLLCLYDLDCFDGALVTSALRTHPVIFVNGMVLQNPYYSSPTEYARVS